VIDYGGGAMQQRSYSVTKQGGALVAITQPLSPEEARKHNVNASLLVTEVLSASLQIVARMIDAGEIKPCIGKVYPHWSPG
jgi:hypothetical protein